ncbi:hypothetical protein JCM8097_000620 [Rhodosporidiobolus ruineniae]
MPSPRLTSAYLAQQAIAAAASQPSTPSPWAARDADKRAGPDPYGWAGSDSEDSDSDDDDADSLCDEYFLDPDSSAGVAVKVAGLASELSPLARLHLPTDQAVLRELTGFRESLDGNLLTVRALSGSLVLSSSSHPLSSHQLDFHRAYLAGQPWDYVPSVPLHRSNTPPPLVDHEGTLLFADGSVVPNRRPHPPSPAEPATSAPPEPAPRRTRSPPPLVDHEETLFFRDGRVVRQPSPSAEPVWSVRLAPRRREPSGGPPPLVDHEGTLFFHDGRVVRSPSSPSPSTATPAPAPAPAQPELEPEPSLSVSSAVYHPQTLPLSAPPPPRTARTWRSGSPPSMLAILQHEETLYPRPSGVDLVPPPVNPLYPVPTTTTTPPSAPLSSSTVPQPRDGDEELVQSHHWIAAGDHRDSTALNRLLDNLSVVTRRADQEQAWRREAERGRERATATLRTAGAEVGFELVQEVEVEEEVVEEVEEEELPRISSTQSRRRRTERIGR